MNNVHGNPNLGGDCARKPGAPCRCLPVRGYRVKYRKGGEVQSQIFGLSDREYEQASMTPEEIAEYREGYYGETDRKEWE